MKKEVVAPQMVLALRNNPKYEGIHGLAKTMYDCYADRAKCSAYHAKNGDNRFVDKKGVFIYYSNDKMCKILGVSDRTVSKFRKQLVEAGLIDIIREGLIGYKIYVKDPEPAPENVDWLLKPSVIEVDEENEVIETDSVKKVDEVAENNIGTSQQTKVHSRCENSSVSSCQKPTTSDNQESVSQEYINTSETNVTRETGKVEQSSPAAPSQTFEDLALEGLKDRVIKTMGAVGVRVWGKIHMIAQGSYVKANELVKSIYKAKSQVFQRVRSIYRNFGDIPEIQDVVYDSIYFEKNDLLAKGLETALIRIIEIHYKSRSEVKNLEGFMYTFLRNSISQNVELYIEEQTNGYHCLHDVAQYVHNTLNFRAA